MNAETKKVFSDSCIKSNYVLDKKGLGESLLKKAKKKKKDKKRFVETNLIFTWNTIKKKKNIFEDKCWKPDTFTIQRNSETASPPSVLFLK